MADTLPPGRELDRRVAVRVLGWYPLSNQEFDRIVVPAFSTDPTANREVREWLVAHRPGVWLRNVQSGWSVDYGYVYPTLEHAICLAALQVAEEEQAAKADAAPSHDVDLEIEGIPFRLKCSGDLKPETVPRFTESMVHLIQVLTPETDKKITAERDEARQQADQLQAELTRVQAERDDYAERISRVAEAIAGEAYE